MITPAYALTATERVLPRMALDFTTGVLDPRVTVTRALNTATLVNSSGYVEGVNANLPRFDYDPATLAPKGLLIEEARTNLFLQSQTFESLSWSKILSTVSSNAANGPDNTLTADKLIPNNGATLSGAITFQDIAKAAAATTYTYSVFGKSDGYDRILLRCQDSGGSTNRANVTVNVSTGAIVTAASVGGTFTNASAKVTTYKNGYFRVELTFTSSADIFLRSQIYALDSIATTGDGVKGILIWGAQLEAGAFATSYIPTTTLPVLRNADAVSMTGTNFSSWYNASEGAFLFQFTPDLNLVSNINRVANVSQGGATARVADIYTSGGFWTMFNGTTAFVTGASVVTSVSQKITAAYKASNYALTLNGAAPTANNSALLNTPNQIAIGSFGGSNYLNGHMQKILYWPQRIINAEVQAFSNL